MAYGKIKADTLVYDNSGSDVEVTLASLVTKAETTGETFTGDITLDNQKELRLSEPDSAGSNYVGFEAPDTIASNVIWALPNADGGAGQYLKTDGSGHLSWGTDVSTDSTKLPLAGGTMTGAITFDASQTFDGVDVSTLPTLAADQTWTGAQRGDLGTLTSSSGGTAVDLSVANNFNLTLGENSTLAQPSNQVPGQSGSIFITQHTGGGFTLGYHADWKWAGGSSGQPTLSTAAGAVDRIDYIVSATNKIHAVATLDVK